MPDWCENDLTITGPKKTLVAFKEAVKSDNTDLSLEKLYPIPEDADWHERHKNWGTVWDVELLTFKEGKNNLYYFFLSAWAPPFAWLEKVSADFPQLQFELAYWFEDELFSMIGQATARKGKVRDNRCDI